MMISVLAIRPLLAELVRREIDVEPLLESAGIDALQLADLRAHLPAERMQSLVELALRESQDPLLGVAVGLNAKVDALRILSYLMVSRRTLRQAVRSFLAYAHHLCDQAHWDLVELGDRAVMSWVAESHAGSRIQFAADAVIAGMLTVTRWFVPAVRPLEVWFAGAASELAHEYREAFKCPVSFSRPVNALHLPSEVLDAIHIHHDDAMATIFEEAASRFVHRVDSRSVADRVRALLLEQEFLRIASLRTVAARLKLSQRALRRKLANERTSVTVLRKEAHCRTACAALGQPGASIKHIAYELGYAERSTFHRAFRRWTGMTPCQFVHEAQWRFRHQTLGAGPSIPSTTASRG